VEDKPPLTQDEYSSLLEVAGGGTMQREIPSAHQEKLFGLKYIEQPSGVPTVTDSGRARAARGN
jgi:hypothetical protein